MSRCFAYPPPGFSVSRGSGPALIESIELQRGSELAKAETKKDRKRDKKGRGKEMMEISKGCLLTEKKIHKRSSSGPKIRSLQKLIQSENEQLERSSLTEELEQPVGEQKPSTSSDSTENSSKRKRAASTPSAVLQEEHSKPSKGNVVRIRLSLQKRNASVSKQEPCSTTSKRAELPSHEQTNSKRAELPSHEQQTTSKRAELPLHEQTTSKRAELPLHEQTTSRRAELLSHEQTTSRRTELQTTSLRAELQITARKTELPLHEHKVASISREQPCSTSARSGLAISNNHQECQVNVPFVQRGHNSVICSRPPTCEVNKVSSASGPSVRREDNAASTSQMLENKLPEVALPHNNVICLRPLRREVNKVSSASGPSVNREDNGAFISQMPENKLPKAALPPRPDGKIVSTLGVSRAITRKDDIAVRDPKSLDKKMVKADLRYRDLFWNWVPPPPQTELVSEDQDWLFSKKKNPDNQTEKKLQPNISCCSNPSLWPRAQFIPEADIHALPFMVPF